VALSLLFEEYASHIHINDADRSVYALWHTVLEDTEALCRRIDRAKLTVREWDRQREIHTGGTPGDDLDLAFATFFLNRTSRSGIIGGGIIGGRDQEGEWKIDARWNPGDLIRRVRKIARFRSRITVTNRDAADYLRDVLPDIDSPFLYLDPPYYHKGPELYRNFYEHEDHQEIATLTRALNAPWIVSYDAVAPIEKLYRQSPRVGTVALN
jgi:DNA adenine methylase